MPLRRHEHHGLLRTSTRKRAWLVPIAALVAAALLYRNRASLGKIRANVSAFEMPTAWMYDALASRYHSGNSVR